MRQMQNKYSFQLFDDILDNNYYLRSDITEDEENFKISMEIPGFKKEEINICYENNYLIISAKKENYETEKEISFIKKERYYGLLKRSFYLSNVKEEDIKAKYEDGILNIIVPKTSDSNKEIRNIKIN